MIFCRVPCNLGLTPEAGASLLLPQLTGYAKAAELLLLGEMFNAETALQYGLINDIVQDQDMDTVIAEKAKKLSTKPLNAITETKRLLKKHNLANVNATIKEELQVFTQRLQSAEAKKAFQSFLSKQTATT